MFFYTEFLAAILVGEIQFIPYAILIAVTHGIIDLIKLNFQKKKTKRSWFVVDQIAHILILIGVVLTLSKAKQLHFHGLIISFGFYYREFYLLLNQLPFSLKRLFRSGIRKVKIAIMTIHLPMQEITLAY